MHCTKHHCTALHCTFTVQDVVIAVAVESGKDTLDMAAVAPTLEDVKELKTIEKISESCQDLALADTIADSESGRNFSSKSDVGELLEPPHKKIFDPLQTQNNFRCLKEEKN